MGADNLYTADRLRVALGVLSGRLDENAFRVCERLGLDPFREYTPDELRGAAEDVVFGWLTAKAG